MTPMPSLGITVSHPKASVLFLASYMGDCVCKTDTGDGYIANILLGNKNKNCTGPVVPRSQTFAGILKITFTLHLDIILLTSIQNKNIRMPFAFTAYMYMHGCIVVHECMD